VTAQNADYVRWPIANIDRRWHFVWQVGEAVGHRPVRWWWLPDALRAAPDWLRHHRYQAAPMPDQTWAEVELELWKADASDLEREVVRLRQWLRWTTTHLQGTAREAVLGALDQGALIDGGRDA
jgi:hypothetical protein